MTMTPRTDALCLSRDIADYAELARTLETELAASRAECERLRALAEHISLNPYGLTQDQWATEARAALRGDV